MTRLCAPTQSPAAVLLHAATLLVLLLAYPQPQAAAQASVPLGLGDRVRVTAPGLVPGRAVGSVLALSDTLLLQDDAGESLLAIPIASVIHLEVSRGRRSRWARGLGVGFLGGALVGAVYGGTNAGTGPGEIDLPTDVAMGLSAAFFGAGGALVGLVIGAMIRTDDWVPVPAERLVVALVPPVAGTATVRLSLAVR